VGRGRGDGGGKCTKETTLSKRAGRKTSDFPRFEEKSGRDINGFLGPCPVGGCGTGGGEWYTWLGYARVEGKTEVPPIVVLGRPRGSIEKRARQSLRVIWVSDVGKSKKRRGRKLKRRRPSGKGKG